jgi:hypothetical protein
MSTKKIEIEKLIDSFADLASSDPAILDDMLKDFGYDPEDIGDKGEQLIKKLIFQKTVELKKNKLSNLYSEAIQLVQIATADTKEAIFSLLRKKSPSLQFNKLERLDTENLKQILTETEVLDLIDKLEKGEIK